MRRSLIAALSLLIAGITACNRAPQTAPAPEQAPAPLPAAAPAPAAPALARQTSGMCIPEEGCIHVCVIRGAEMRMANVIYNPATGDSTYRGQRFGDAFPVTPSFAQNADWYVNDEPVMYKGRRYVKYGLPRLLGPGDVVSDGEILGVPVFVEPSGPFVGVMYVPVKPACEFQPYTTTGIK